MQDPLALLSESENEDEDVNENENGASTRQTSDDAKEAGSPSAKRRRLEGAVFAERKLCPGEVDSDAPLLKGGSLGNERTANGSSLDSSSEAGAPKLRLEDLRGYQPANLLQTESYIRDAQNQEARAAKLHPLMTLFSTPSSTSSHQGNSLDPENGELAAEDKPMQEEQNTDGSATAANRPSEEEAAPMELGCARPVKVDKRVNVGGNREVPEAWSNFDSTVLPPKIVSLLSEAGLRTPTPIQAHACPVLAAGRDLVGIAQTGSGKTLAYLLPCFVSLLSPGGRVRKGGAAAAIPGSPLMLVLAPTRELAIQIEREANRFNKAGIRVSVAYGGAPQAPQLAGLRSTPDLLVATPGRLNDFLRTAQVSVSVKSVRFMVLDEADRMLDDGFEEQVRFLLETADLPGRQTMLFSATWPDKVRDLASEFLKDPVEIRIGNADVLRANPDINQDIMVLNDQHEKVDALVGVLHRNQKARAMVFVATKKVCQLLLSCLRSRVSGGVEAIHGDRSQRDREAALAAFREHEVRILLATDVAGRGLDVPDITIVVNFDPPHSAEDYVHRIGRTGRAGRSGQAVSLLTWRDTQGAAFIAEVMERTGLHVPPILEQLSGSVGFLTAADKRRIHAEEAKLKARDRIDRVASISEKRDLLFQMPAN
eukprot:CAMPEP_0206438042 /NCGR_PEP_ID=MMETSP0324_2-20121206/11388_1 /ASSEMBLY_ACC=CAM_ASM_000836 /TAXON_ID=2866 /ORGANISM="Crypthecodinium cohnii, Strain Seligo" /LENGTH=652 /DNA_ID=CAMNT_0053905413 /DNA_START=54 /DNA_END=2009 /DNA_ORIENTATION=-